MKQYKTMKSLLLLLPLCFVAAMLVGSCSSDDGDGSVSLTDGMWLSRRLPCSA